MNDTLETLCLIGGERGQRHSSIRSKASLLYVNTGNWNILNYTRRYSVTSRQSYSTGGLLHCITDDSQIQITPRELSTIAA